MKNWMLRFRAMVAFSRIHPHIAHAPEWTQDDAKKLAVFMARSPTGRKLATIMWHHAQACAFRATIERNHATYECGYASGARGLAAVIDSLSEVQEPEKVTAQTEEESFMSTLPPELSSLVNQ